MLKEHDVRIYPNSKVEDVKKTANRYEVKTNKHSIDAKYVVMATHYPIKKFQGLYFLKLYQDKSYEIAIMPQQKMMNGMYIAAESTGKSFRPINNELLIIGGEEHKTGENAKNLESCYSNLIKYSKKIFPTMSEKYKWSTQDCVSLDKVAYIGEISKLMPHVYIATGYNKWGMTTSHVAAKIISDEILGKENKYKEIYQSTRMNLIKNNKEFGSMLKQTAYSLCINKLKIPKYKFENIENNNRWCC